MDIEAHRFWLSSHSPVFRAMFESDMKEKESGVIKINDCDPYVMKALISFLYTEVISPQIDRLQLLILADKYQISHLVEQCLQVCIRTLMYSISN